MTHHFILVTVYSFDLFKTQSYRVQYYFHIPTFVARMSADDPTERPHPGLLNAMYLMACYFSSLDPTKSVSFAAQEAYFLSKAQAALTDSLSLSDRLLDFIRGSNLVVSYLFNRGRFLEGSAFRSGFLFLIGVLTELPLLFAMRQISRSLRQRQILPFLRSPPNYPSRFAN